MLEEESFNEFYTKINDLRNSVISLGMKILYAKLSKKVFRSLPERFRIKVSTIEESKDLDNMKIEELVGSPQTYEFFLPPLKKGKSIALKAAKEKVSKSSNDEDELAMFAINFRKLMNSKKNLGTKMLNFLKILKGNPKELIK
jgi:hypothetical protein